MTPLKVRSLLPVAEIALAVVTLAAVMTFWRLFADRSFLAPLAVLAIAAHGTVIVCRRAGLGLPTAAAVTTTVGALVHSWVLYPATTTFGVPTSLTFDAARDDLSHAWSQFSEVSAPSPVETGFLVAAGLAIWASAFIADWAAFRLWVPFEAVVPAGTLWLFASILGSDNSRVQATLLYGGAVLGFVLLHRTVRQQVSASWLAADVARGSGALLRVGGALLGGALVLAAVAGPLLPGARAEPWVDMTRWGDGPSRRQVPSPLVSVRGQLDELSRVEVFTVDSPQRSYWRLTALDTFNGEIWGSSYSYRGVDDRLPDRYPSNAPVEPVEQQFRILAMHSVWLPAAFEARAFIGQEDSIDARWDRESSTLIADSRFSSSDGAIYTVRSDLPQLTEAALAEADAAIPGGVAERYLQLPNGFSDRVSDEARQITAEAASPFEQARALQDWFRANFEYSLEGVPEGHDGDAMEAFIFELRQGYCEQFAASFAAMARVIGLPSRVAVGFTPGEPDPTVPNRYHVRGEHAHAWPEVFIAGYGWVPFEPTPQRGIPNAENYTGVPEQQAESGNPSSATTVPTTRVTIPEEQGPDATAEPLDPDGGLDVGAGGAGGVSTGGRGWWDVWVPRMAWLAAAVLALAVLYLLVVPLSHVVRRRARRKRATTPDDQVRVAWEESVEALSVVGVDPRRWETPAEFAARSGSVVALDLAEPLAASLEAVDYSPDGVNEEQASAALVLADGIGTAVRQLATRQQRLRAVLDPRAVHRRRDGRRHWLAKEPEREGPRVELVDR